MSNVVDIFCFLIYTFLVFFTKIKRIFYLLLFLILTFTCSNDLLAVDSLSNNFSFLDLDTNWLFVHDSGYTDNSWRIENNILIGEIHKNSSSYLFSKKNDLDNFSFEFESLNYSGVDQEILFRVSDLKDKYYLLNLRFNDIYWPQDGGEIVLWKYSNNNYSKLISINPNDFNINLTQGNFHKIKIICDGSKIDVYFDNENIISYIDIDPFLTGGIGFLNWGGNYYRRSTKNAFNNLKVNYLEQNNRNKIIIIPGLGASWNFDSIFLDKEISNNDWKMTPLVKTYEPIIELLEENGLKENDDFFIWNYDWKKSLFEISEDLDLFIQENIDNKERIDFIGHSLGGLVARIWTQSNNSKVDNLITFGSPHKGSLDVYEVWNGGKVSKIDDISSLIMQLFLVLKNKGLTTTDLNRIRLFAPILKDLLPIENYVIKNNELLDNSNLETKNDYLFNKNLEFVENNLDLNSVVGIGFSTPSFIKLKERVAFETVLGIWPDGKPIGYEYSSGDKTVLKSSALFNSNNSIEINSNHTQIIEDGIDFMIDVLSLDKPIYFNKNEENVNYNNGLFLFIGSPAKLEVICGDDSYIDDDGFIFIEDKNYSDCIVNLNPTDDGQIHLVFGNTSSLSWYFLEKNVFLNKKISFYLDFNSGNILQKQYNYSFLKSLISEDLISLGLIKEIKSLEKNNFLRIINGIFKYREKTNERVITQRILKNLYLISSIDCNNRFYKKDKTDFWLYKYEIFITKVLRIRSKRKRINKFSALSTSNLKSFINFTDNVNCINNKILHKISIGYGREILKN